METQGIGDAAAAVTKVTGITKQEGSKSLNVRGLGDRYNTTTLNGLPLPSNNAEVKNIDLELFSTDIISHIDIEKTYSPWLYGDFGGANINIASKQHHGSDFVKVKIEGGLNTNTLDAEKFYLQDGPTSNGFYNGYEPDVNKIESGEVYDFQNSWNPQEKTIYPDAGLGLMAGKTFNFNQTSKLHVFFDASFENNRNYTTRIERIVSGSDLPLNNLKGEQYEYNTQTTGLLNVNYSSLKHDIYFNSMLLNSSEQELVNLIGTIRDVGDINAYRRNSEYERNFVLVNQLLGHDKITDKLELDWGVGYNIIDNTVPDRLRNTFSSFDSVTNIGEFDPEAAGINYRYFHSFTDNEIGANLRFGYTLGKPFGDAKYRAKISVGYSGRFKNRDFKSNQFDHAIEAYNFVRIKEDVNNIDNYINNENFRKDTFNVNIVRADGKPGFSYNAELFNHAGFGMIEYNISEKLMVLLGARFEYVYQYIEYLSTQNQTGKTEDTEFEKVKLLPSVSIRYKLNNKNNIRLSGSETYTLPQFNELPFIVFDGIIDRTYGNPYLYPSTVYNADLKYEFFPNAGELISATLFGKYIEDPINKFVVNGTLNEYTNANTGDWAYLYGIELDARKDLIKRSSASNDQKLFLATNITLMKTRQELNSDKIRKETHNLFNSTFEVKEEVLQGAAPLIGNATLGYNYKWKNLENSLNTAIVYNYVSDRLYAIGHSSLGNKVDKAINTLDFVAKSEYGNLGIGLKIQNILNPVYERIQENDAQDWLVYSYKKGTKIKLSLSYKF